MVQNRGIFRRNMRSRKTRNSVHVPPEWMFTLSQNTQCTGQPVAPESFGLIGLRNPDNISTTLLPLRSVLAKLESETINELMKPIFHSTSLHRRTIIASSAKFSGLDRWLLRVYGYKFSTLPVLKTHADKQHIMGVTQ